MHFDSWKKKGEKKEERHLLFFFFKFLQIVPNSAIS